MRSMIGLLLSRLSLEAVSRGVKDLAAAHADIGERAIVHRHQLIDGAARATPGLEPGDRSDEPALQPRSDPSFGAARRGGSRRIEPRPQNLLGPFRLSP